MREKIEKDPSPLQHCEHWALVKKIALGLCGLARVSARMVDVEVRN